MKPRDQAPGPAGPDPAGPDPADPDVGADVPVRGLWDGQGPVFAVVAAGGALGAVARYGAAVLWPTVGGAFPWTTFLVNVVGCALIGVLMASVAELRPHTHRLVRPFLGTGVLGGFTTFSTYVLDVRGLLVAGRYVAAAGCLFGTMAAAVLTVWGSASLARYVLRERPAGALGTEEA
ncbi:fluoride efflux transporter FluC [Streptomyces sp. CA-253872]|uniref:fluoride efflux transporter FluC n=1 Tax=Streptomyces sp. CA-253872 TaxID=3240067 RepID=UPI003D9266C2